MNGPEMLRILDSIARDRNIDRALLLRDLELAMVSAARKHFNTLDTEEFHATIDPVNGVMSITRHGEALDMTPQAFGRIAAQTFKQVMIQKFRDDERSTILEEFSKRVGDIVTGTAQRYEGGSLVVTIDRAEAFMPRSEQIPGEQFNAGDRVRCLILDVRDAGSQVKIVLSRGNPDFIKRLFEVEVPEVAERIIEIKAMAREAGYRTKIAVSSVDSKVDAVGANDFDVSAGQKRPGSCGHRDISLWVRTVSDGLAVLTPQRGLRISHAISKSTVISSAHAHTLERS